MSENVLLQRSSKIIDSGEHDPQVDPINPLTNELHELNEQVAVITSFARVVAVKTNAGIVLFDTSTGVATEKVLSELRSWSQDPIHTVFYTHGHLDHVSGSGTVRQHAIDRGEPAPRFVGHQNIARRWARYRRTNQFNLDINSRQNNHLANPNFTIGPNAEARARGVNTFVPEDVVEPDTTFTDVFTENIGGLTFSVRHVLAETDDHSWIHIPELKTVIGADLISWNFPNAGNPQKIQRYPAEWAQALRDIIAVEPELYVPMHGLPITGHQRITTVLGDTAEALETIVDQVVDAMNQGHSLPRIVEQLRLPTELMAKPWLRPRYDDPEFMIRTVWRSYAGWWDGEPVTLKPASRTDVARALAEMVSNGLTLKAAAEKAVADGQLDVATELATYAAAATPEDPEVHRTLAEVYATRAESEPSTMCKGVFVDAAERASAKATELGG
ncbi:alkyl sulfatase dimerization domain-containing protein [Micrococcoides hystricis]|uniref:Alkyl sulfatase dimerization domain-containing protein n=1 Tax=Micrococcoides hystricis TaxID=1572761 RepID=A0ABV6PCF1_9MICC